jgi:hypothetical protein
VTYAPPTAEEKAEQEAQALIHYGERKVPPICPRCRAVSFLHYFMGEECNQRFEAKLLARIEALEVAVASK